jgi:hypothetical protein
LNLLKRGFPVYPASPFFRCRAAVASENTGRTYNKILPCRQSEMIVFPQVATCGYENPTFQVKPLHPVYCASLCVEFGTPKSEFGTPKSEFGTLKFRSGFKLHPFYSAHFTTFMFPFASDSRTM